MIQKVHRKKITHIKRHVKPKLNSRAGFTLIELLVVISIISLLASMILVGLNTARVAALDLRRIQYTNKIHEALELYFADNGYYPGFHDPSSTVFYSSNGTNPGNLSLLIDPLRPYLSADMNILPNTPVYYDLLSENYPGINANGLHSWGNCPGAVVTIRKHGYALSVVLQNPNNNPQYKPGGDYVFPAAQFPGADSVYMFVGGIGGSVIHC